MFSTPTATGPTRHVEIGVIGGVVLASAAAAALYFILVPLLMLLAAAFRGPQDLLPFEPGTQWTIANIRDVYLERSLYTSIIPNTLVFTVGSVTLTLVLAFILAWLVERTELPGRNAVYTIVVFPLLIPGVVLAVAWIFLLDRSPGLPAHPKTGSLERAESGRV